ncbi:MAG TPA: NADH-quinone oxidoreductase subunit J [Solirubrobacteraceae bacterium]|nr:NADH-quinone oxidoreductase subunit J [Solirubrobacteraceae bacterium]
MSTIFFFLAAFGAIAGAIGVIALRDPFFSVLALVAHLLSLAILFLLLRAEFVAAAQVVVYAGAVMVLYVFVVAYIGDGDESIGNRLRRSGSHPPGANLRLGAAVLGGALLVELLIALLGSGLKAIEGYGAGYTPGPRTYGTPAYIGNLLLTRFLLAFEIASFLLLIAAVGGVVLARRRGGLEEEPAAGERALTPLDLLRPRGTGTMAEGVTGLAFAAAHAGNGVEEAELGGVAEGRRAPAVVGAPEQSGSAGHDTEGEGGW